jgi:hypothetical protein
MNERTFKAACAFVGIDISRRAVSAPAPAQRVEPLVLVKKARRAEYPDAVEVWNACGGGIGRPRLQKELKTRGFECSDYLAGDLLSQIIEKIEAVAVDGVAVGGDE